jgi:chlorobactene glucosyltransferase
VLVPARNEEANIGPCLYSLLAQDYPDFQVLVLNDASTDKTAEVLAALVAGHDRLHVLRGKPLPPGWLGKQWACRQLAQAADGELLLFTDADTRHQPQALRAAVAALQAEQADFLSAWPRQETVSWAEKLIIPVISWSLFCILPLSLAYRLRHPALSAAIGQFMLFRREAYQRIGGHAAVRGHGVEDLALARRVKAGGLRWRLVDGGRHVRCRMYTNFSQAYAGLSKNLFAAFDYKALPFVFAWFWLGVVFVEPPLLLAFSLAGAPLPGMSLSLAALSVAAALLLWGLHHRRFGFSLHLAWLYPLPILLALFIAMRSLALTLAGQATWKGRILVRPKVSWW